MRKDIHPDCHEISATCSCGNVMRVRSTLSKDFRVEVCAKCHPFYTNQHKIIDTGGRVERFRRRFGSVGKPPTS